MLKTLDIKLWCPHAHICTSTCVYACMCTDIYTNRIFFLRVRMRYPEKQLGVQTRSADTNSQEYQVALLCVLPQIFQEEIETRNCAIFLRSTLSFWTTPSCYCLLLATHLIHQRGLLRPKDKRDRGTANSIAEWWTMNSTLCLESWGKSTEF